MLPRRAPHIARKRLLSVHRRICAASDDQRGPLPRVQAKSYGPTVSGALFGAGEEEGVWAPPPCVGRIFYLSGRRHGVNIALSRCRVVVLGGCVHLSGQNGALRAVPPWHHGGSLDLGRAKQSS